jgi:hypothetical protein
MTDELKTTIKERLRSPLFGNFIVSWLILNWKIPYLTIFVSEEVLHGKTKIEEIKNIIHGYEYPFLMLWIIPLASTAFMIFLYPFIFNWLEMLRLYFQKWLKEIHEERDNELLPIKTKAEILTHEKNHILSDMLKDYKYSIFHFGNKLERLFAGQWTIEVYKENCPVIVYENCQFENGTFADSNGVLFDVNKLEESNKNSHYENANYILMITINKQTSKYHLSINSRILLQASRDNDYKNRIRFIWKGI